MIRVLLKFPPNESYNLMRFQDEELDQYLVYALYFFRNIRTRMEHYHNEDGEERSIVQQLIKKSSSISPIEYGISRFDPLAFILY